MRRSHLWLAWALVVVAMGCGSTSSLPIEPDPRLGQLVVIAETEHTATQRLRQLSCAHLNDGRRFLLLSQDAAFRFGLGSVRPSMSRVFEVAPDGGVTEWPPPPVPVLSSCAPKRCANIVPTVDGAGAAVFDADTSSSPSFLLLAAIGDGTTWQQLQLLPSDVASHVRRTWGPTDQVRFYRGGQALVQHADVLLRFDASGWSRVTRPPGARSLRLGSTFEGAIQVTWLDGQGHLFVDVLNPDGSWRGPRLETTVPADSSFNPDGAALSGTFESFIVVLKFGTQGRLVLRYAEGRWVRASVGDATSLAWTKGLKTGSHPSRALSQDGATLTGIVEGKSIGAVGGIFGWSAHVLVSCEACRPGLGKASLDDACRRCVSREVPVPASCFAPDSSAYTAVVVDEFFDAYRRVYLKTFPLPMPAGIGLMDEPVARPEGWNMPNNPDAGIGIDGEVWFRAAPVEGASVTIRTLTGNDPVTARTDSYGRFFFSGLPDTGWLVSVELQGALPVAHTVPAGSGGAQLTIQLLPDGVNSPVLGNAPVTEVLERRRLIVARSADGTASGLVLEPTSTLSFASVPLQSNDQLEVRFDGSSRAAVGVRRGATGLINQLMGIEVLPAPLASIDDVRSTSAMLLVPDGPVDGATLRTWYQLHQRGQPTRLSPQSFLDVRPVEGDTRFLVWTLDASNQPVVAELSMVGWASSYVSQVPVPRLSRVGLLTTSPRVYWGIEGEDCLRRRGSEPPCRMWSLRVDQFAGRLEPSVLSNEVVDFDVANDLNTYTLGVLERSRFVIHRSNSPVEVVAENLTLPAEVAPEGRLVVPGGPGGAQYLVHTGDGLFWSLTGPNRWRLAARDVVALFPVRPRNSSSVPPDALAVQLADGTSCETGGCRYLLLLEGQSMASPVLRGSDVRVSRQGVATAVASTACPGTTSQACTLLSSYGYSEQSPPTHVGFGEFVIRPGATPVFGLRSSLRGPGLFVERPLTESYYSLSSAIHE